MSSSTNPGPRPTPRTIQFTNSTLDPGLRSTINELLLNNNCVPAIHATLLHECQASGFVEQIRVRAMDLLRTGKVTSFSDCLEQIMASVKLETEDGDTTGSTTNGTTGAEGDEAIVVPKRVVKEGREALMGALEPYLEFSDKTSGS